MKRRQKGDEKKRLDCSFCEATMAQESKRQQRHICGGCAELSLALSATSLCTECQDQL